MKTPWSRSALFYWAFLWRALALYLGFVVPFILFYPIVEYFLSDWPLLEHLVRALLLLALMLIAMLIALRWASQKRFGGMQLWLYPVRISGGAEPSTGGTLSYIGHVAPLLWAQFWRSIVLTGPVNLLLGWVLFGRPLLVPGNFWQQLPQVVLDMIVGTAAGIWAMREAISLTYRTFALRWLPAPEPGTESGPAVPPE